MRHVVKKTDWCVIDIDTTNGRIFLQQKWKYHWTVVTGLPAWTYSEKKDFHSRADRNIWAAWSNRVKINVTGSSTFARRYRAGVPINLDVRWVLADEHWNVNVWKIPPDAFRTSNVIWDRKIINLDTNDFVTRKICRLGRSSCTSQVPVAHEFGHAAGNTKVLGRGDEYPDTSKHRADQSSIMHSGNQLRDRHFRTILDQMNTMMPDTTFSVRSC